MSENGGKACIRQKSWFFVSNIIANFLCWFKLSPGCWYLLPPSYLPFPVFIKFDRAVVLGGGGGGGEWGEIKDFSLHIAKIFFLL